MGFLIDLFKGNTTEGETPKPSPKPLYNILANYELERQRDPQAPVDHVYKTLPPPAEYTVDPQLEFLRRIAVGKPVSHAESEDYLNKTVRAARRSRLSPREVIPGILGDTVDELSWESAQLRHAANKHAAKQTMKQYAADKIEVPPPGSWLRPWSRSEDNLKNAEALLNKDMVQRVADEAGKQKNALLKYEKNMRNNPNLLRLAEQAKLWRDSLNR